MARGSTLVTLVMFVACADRDVVGAPTAPTGPAPPPTPPTPTTTLTTDEPAEDVSASSRDADDDVCSASMYTDHAPGAHGLFVFEAQAGSYGFRDVAGRVLISPRFRFAYEFSPDGVAGAIDMQGRPVFIDTHGQVIAEAFLFDNGPDYFVSGLARIVRNGKIGFIDRRGRVALEPRWDWAGSFCGGHAIVCNGCVRGTADEHDVYAGGQWGAIDRAGRVIVPVAYDSSDRVASELQK